MIEKTTKTPPTAPINVATTGVGVSGPAVMATKPAKAPFKIIVKSALLKSTLEIIKAPRTPPAAAALVFKKTIATAFELAISPNFKTEPPLKPNQPIHKMKVPSVARGRFAPGIGFTSPFAPYLPLREPNKITPARAAAAPAM